MDCGIDGKEMNTHAEINWPFTALPRLKAIQFLSSKQRRSSAKVFPSMRVEQPQTVCARCKMFVWPYCENMSEPVRAEGDHTSTGEPHSYPAVPLSVNRLLLAAGHPD